MRLDKTRIRQTLFERAQNRIEPFDVPDLENETARGRQFRQLSRMRGVIGDRFFDEQMFAAGQKLASNFKMRDRRGRDRGGVYLFGKFFQRRSCLNAKFSGPFFGDPAFGIVNRGELSSR